MKIFKGYQKQVNEAAAKIEAQKEKAKAKALKKAE